MRRLLLRSWFVQLCSWEGAEVGFRPGVGPCPCALHLHIVVSGNTARVTVGFGELKFLRSAEWFGNCGISLFRPKSVCRDVNDFYMVVASYCGCVRDCRHVRCPACPHSRGQYQFLAGCGVQKCVFLQADM